MSGGRSKYSLLPQTPTFDAFEYDCDSFNTNDNRYRVTMSSSPQIDERVGGGERKKGLLGEMEFGEGESLMGALDLGERFGDGGEKGGSSSLTVGQGGTTTRSSFDMMSEEGTAGRSIGGSAVLVEKRTKMAPEERESDLARRYAESVEERPGLERKQSTLRVHVVDDDEDDARNRRPSVATTITIDEHPPTPPPHRHHQQQHHQTREDPTEQEGYGQLDFSRPTTPGSLFQDFDGVHCEPVNQTPRNSIYPPEPPQELNQRASAQNLSEYLENPRRARPQSSMVYYPAPVPAVLNLPPLLSHNRRKESQDMDKAMANNRRSTAFTGPTTPGVQTSMEMPKSKAHEHMDPRRASRLPPSMRASMMLDPNTPAMPPIDLTSGSAVDALNSILDASASAPPIAFTDHPMSGTAPISYRHSKMPSLGGGRPLSTLSLLNPGHASQSHLPTAEGEADQSSQPPSPAPHQTFSDEQIVPTTLLAELESRKAKQKLRNRTAADLNPAGIRSTLLELDAVAEVAQNHRKNQRTHLAWQEDGNSSTGSADDDVPLAVLYASTAPKTSKDGPILTGLLQKRELEDTEPLSARRARLRAEKGLTSRPADTSSTSSESETLAQRRARLKSTLPKPDLGSSLSLTLTDPATTTKPKPAEEEEEEETLAQRRARLQSERSQKAALSSLHSQIRTHNALTHHASRSSLLATQQAQGRGGSYYAGPGKGLVANPGPAPMGGMAMGGMAMGMGMQQQQQYYHPAAVAAGYGLGAQGGLQQLAMQQGFVPLDQKQRDMVERWRESVM